MNPTFSSMVEALGWALVHCLWQGTVLALGLAVLLRALKGAGASLRYGLATGALGIMVAAFGVTLVACWPTAQIAALPPPALKKEVPLVRENAAASPTESPAQSAPIVPDRVAETIPEMAPKAPAVPASVPWNERFRAWL